VRIVGHGVEVDGHWFCGGHCAKAEGAAGIVDRVGSMPGRGGRTRVGA
jgi:hypothetical protein